MGWPNLRFGLLVCVLLLGSGCGTLRCKYYCVSGNDPDAMVDAPDSKAVRAPTIISVSGYGALDPSLSNATQQRLMGLRASKLDAYRALAERLRGVQINSSSRVEDFLARYDHLNAVVDAYVSQAKVVSQFVNAMGACETVLALELDPGFYQQMAKSDPVLPVAQMPDTQLEQVQTDAADPAESLATMSVREPQHELVDEQEPVEVEPWGE